MGKNALTTAFLKECMADAILKLMQEKDFSKITINEIADKANVNRTTWFRNFNTKNEALTFKLIQLWERWADQHNLSVRNKFTIHNALDFFQFNYEIRSVLETIYKAQLQSVIYDAFYQVMTPQYGAYPEECYQSRFYAHGLFGLLDEWVKREFLETPEQMVEIFHKVLANQGTL